MNVMNVYGALYPDVYKVHVVATVWKCDACEKKTDVFFTETLPHDGCLLGDFHFDPYPFTCEFR